MSGQRLALPEPVQGVIPRTTSSRRGRAVTPPERRDLAAEERLGVPTAAHAQRAPRRQGRRAGCGVGHTSESQLDLGRQRQPLLARTALNRSVISGASGLPFASMSSRGAAKVEPSIMAAPVGWEGSAACGPTAVAAG